MQGTVLIVEDEYLIAVELQRIVEDDGWRAIGPAPTVEAALSLLEIERPSVALLDVHLGSELVTPVALALKEKKVPFAVASAYARPEQYGGAVLARVPNAGKPAEKRRLLATLKELLDS
ncbi:MAG: response regulator [Sphingomonas sp. 66-10]|uniref:response regulator n=1 Tax=Sphingomonas sp. 66-10 TaxID=1895848 RepID=UPI00092AFC17|nr:response regulator [Sphingomonas sp. 66-10]OJU20628.1 MAG: response regulator [Sphingomonas sp. 66-10]